MPIRVLDAETVGRIAAGEVVERPASIAKELIENSLDAGASSITIEMKDGGCTYLRVTDNGCGIPPEEARIAFENHATSKIASGDELTDILTLGFRGEALPSIAAVSRITLVTRVSGADSGVKVLVEGGVIQDVSAIGCPEGTTIIVRDLFFNTPVRKTFLKKPATEGGVLSDMVARLILGNPKTSIRLINNGKNVYHSFGDGDSRHAALAIYGRDAAEKLTYVDENEGSIRIHGLIGTGDLEKSNRSHQFFFINGRVVRSQLMTQALEAATRTLVTIGNHPMCALSLILPPHTVDINVHPSKLEVRFRDEASVRLYIESMLSRALFHDKKMLDPALIASEPQSVLEERPPIQILPISSTVNGSGSITNSDNDERPNFQKNVSSHRRTDDLPSSTGTPGESAPTPIQIPDYSKPTVFQETAASVPRPIIAGVPEDRAFRGQSKVQEQTQVSIFESACPPKTETFRVLGVFANTYILAECKDALLIIDQHAAHERIRYQEYERALHAGTAMQQLLTPIIMSMSPREQSVLLSEKNLLREAGYEIEPFGERDIQVRAVPYILGRSEMRPLFLEMIDRLDQLKNATIDRRRMEIIQTSCKRAVKAGDVLSSSEIQALVDEMLNTEAPPTCPHGRPVLKVFRKNEIEKMFKRI